MGCCFRPRKIKTKIDTNTSEEKTPKIHGSGRGNSAIDGDRGPPLIEEEIISVKEVLSETPISKPQDSSTSSTVLEEEDRKIEEKSVEEGGEESVVETRSEVFSQVSVSQVSVSQVSEINSVSEGFETAALIEEGEEVASRREYGGAAGGGGGVRRKSRVGKERVVSGETLREKERRVGSPAVRRPAADPEKRNRLVAPSPEKRNRMAAQAAARRRSASPSGRRKDLGGRTGGSRRSRSPATRAQGVASRADCGESRDLTLGKAAAEKSDDPPAVAAEAAEGKSESGKLEKPEEGGDFPETNESLENPNVSLECFIFL